jgi:hypothetical protein
MVGLVVGDLIQEEWQVLVQPVKEVTGVRAALGMGAEVAVRHLPGWVAAVQVAGSWAMGRSLLLPDQACAIPKEGAVVSDHILGCVVGEEGQHLYLQHLDLTEPVLEVAEIIILKVPELVDLVL